MKRRCWSPDCIRGRVLQRFYQISVHRRLGLENKFGHFKHVIWEGCGANDCFRDVEPMIALSLLKVMDE